MDTTSQTALLANYTTQGGASGSAGSASSGALRLGLVILQFVLSIAIILSNIIILHALRVTKSMHRVTHYFLGNLAVADLLFGLFLGTMRLVQLSHVGPFNKMECNALLAMPILAAGVSINGILCIYINTYLSILHLGKSKTGISLRMTKIIISTMWAVFAVYSFMSIGLPVDDPTQRLLPACFLGNDYFGKAYSLVLPIEYLAAYLASICFQISIPIIIRRHFQKNRVTPMAASTQGQAVPGASKAGQKTTLGTDMVATQMKTIKHTEKIVTLVTLVFTISWTPYLVLLFVYLVCPAHCSISPAILQYTSLFISINALANIFIYGFKDREFRSAFKGMFCMWQCARGATTSGSSENKTNTASLVL